MCVNWTRWTHTWNTNANMWKAGGTWNNINMIDHVNCHRPVCPINSDMQSPSSSSAPNLRRPPEPQLFTLCRGSLISLLESLPSDGDDNGMTLAPFDIFSRKFMRFCQKPYFIVSLPFSSIESVVFGVAVVVVVIVVVVVGVFVVFIVVVVVAFVFVMVDVIVVAAVAGTDADDGGCGGGDDENTAVVSIDRNSSLARVPMFDVNEFSSVISRLE